MCGIAGIIGNAVAENLDILPKMQNAITHRGPDASGIWTNPDNTLALIHTRLSIIDLDAAANQPFTDTSERYTITYNGEIYNYKDLRKELERHGANFRTNSDTEILLESYKHWGPDCLNHLNGMFAFAIWDANENRLFCARDRLGKKPFFYTQLPDNSGLAFASEPQTLLHLNTINKALHHSAMRSFLMLGYSTGAQTLHTSIKRLPPAHAMIIHQGETKIWRYWNLLESFENKTDICETKAATEISNLLDNATERRLQSDVPFGLFLSGGLDSSAVLASMCSKIGANNTKTFSIGFSDSRYNEADIAAKTAAHFDTTHKSVTLNPDRLDFDEILNAAAHDPLADASFIPTYELSKAARQSIKMTLSGDGGDELFAGYPTYIANAIHRKLSPFAFFKPPLPAPKKRRSLYYKLYQFTQGLPLDARRAHFSWRIYTSIKRWSNSFTTEFTENFSFEETYKLFEPYYDESAHLAPLDQALYVDTKTWLPDSVLVKMDRATMAHGLEARAPLLDYRMVELAASLPPSMKLKWSGRKFHMKHILRQAQRSRLPAFLFTQPKRGFSVPISNWLRNCDDLHDITRITLQHSPMQNFFNTTHLSTLMDQHTKTTHDHGLMLFNTLMLGKFLQNYI